MSLEAFLWQPHTYIPPPPPQTYGGCCWRIQSICLDGRDKISKGDTVSCCLWHRCVGHSLPELYLAVSTTLKTSFPPWSSTREVVTCSTSVWRSPAISATGSIPEKVDLDSTAHLCFRKCILSVGLFVLLAPRLITAVSLALWTRTSGHWENKAQTFFHPDSYYIIHLEDAAKKEILLCLQSLLPFKAKDSKTSKKNFKKKNSAYTARYLHFSNSIFIFGTEVAGCIVQLSKTQGPLNPTMSKRSLRSPSPLLGHLCGVHKMACVGSSSCASCCQMKQVMGTHSVSSCFYWLQRIPKIPYSSYLMF